MKKTLTNLLLSTLVGFCLSANAQTFYEPLKGKQDIEVTEGRTTPFKTSYTKDPKTGIVEIYYELGASPNSSQLSSCGYSLYVILPKNSSFTHYATPTRFATLAPLVEIGENIENKLREADPVNVTFWKDIKFIKNCLKEKKSNLIPGENAKLYFEPGSIANGEKEKIKIRIDSPNKDIPFLLLTHIESSKQPNFYTLFRTNMKPESSKKEIKFFSALWPTPIK